MDRIGLARKHIQEQWQKIIGKKLDKQQKEVIESHLKDSESFTESKEFINSSQRKRKNYQQIKNSTHRGIFILFKSDCFEIDEIASIVHRSPKTVRRIIAGLT